MPDFDLQITAGAAATGTWTDPVDGDLQSRVNFKENAPQRYFVGTVGTEIEISAIVDGTTGPADGALGGRLFTTWFVECPSPPRVLTHDASESSVQRFTPDQEGHYTVGFERPDGGIMHVHIDVETP